MAAITIETPVYDRTARKAHQWTMVALVAAGLLLQGIAGVLMLALAGAIMLAGRFWWPADVVRQHARHGVAQVAHRQVAAVLDAIEQFFHQLVQGDLFRQVGGHHADGYERAPQLGGGSRKLSFLQQNPTLEQVDRLSPVQTGNERQCSGKLRKLARRRRVTIRRQNRIAVGELRHGSGQAAFVEAAKARDRTGAQLLRDFMRNLVQRQKQTAEHDSWFHDEVEQALREADDPSVRRVPHEDVLSRWHQQRAVLVKSGSG